jgi:hypothetical protein
VPGDLLVITPSRGRPQNAARLIDAVRRTSAAVTHVHIAVDEDDPALPEYRKAVRCMRDGDEFETGPRGGLAAWTNRVAVRRAGEYRYLASFGDDHEPRTPGWDAALIRAIEDTGGTGFAYPWDGTREDIPEAVVVSSDVVAALGWMCEPSLSHWYVDNVWADLGKGAGCIRYLRAVAVDHHHPGAGKARVDATYRAAGAGISADRAAYETWRSERMAADVAVVRELRERAPAPA